MNGIAEEYKKWKIEIKICCFFFNHMSGETQRSSFVYLTFHLFDFGFFVTSWYTGGG
jgi:hypothetical protein